MTKINASIASQDIMLERIEIMGAKEEGRTVIFDNKGSKQLGSDWVINDSRNNGFGEAVPYWIGNVQLGTTSGMNGPEFFNAIVSMMNRSEMYYVLKVLKYHLMEDHVTLV